jgi:hypothetical protein
MAAKKKSTNTTNNDAPNDQDFSLDNQTGDPLSDFFAQFPNANRKFKIGRYVGNVIEHLETTTDIPDEDQLQEIYGGGRFVIRAFSDGIQRGQIEMRIAHKPGYVAPNETPNVPEVDKATNVPMNDDSFIKQLLLKMVGMGANPAVSQPTPVNELAEALKTIHALSGNSGTNTAKEYSEGLKAGIELAKSMGAGGETDWKTELFRMAKDVIPSIATSVASIATKSPMNNNPIKQSPAELIAVPGNVNVTDKIIFNAIQQLKPYALKNTPPDLIVDWVVNNAEQYQEFVRAAFSRSFESFATIDSEIANEPFNKWFKSLYDGLRLAFVPANNVDDNNDGSDGNTGNNANDEDISA